jgi:hypothetical protein
MADLTDRTKGVVGRIVDIGGTCVRAEDDLMEAEGLSFLASNQPGPDCIESNCRTGCRSGTLTIGRMEGVVETTWCCVVAKEADSAEDNFDNVPVPLDVVLTVHTTTSSVAQGDIHPDKGCYCANRVRVVNGETRRRCCRLS